eukprot:1155365-Pelagomonas_calceolata.AAC.8
MPCLGLRVGRGLQGMQKLRGGRTSMLQAGGPGVVERGFGVWRVCSGGRGRLRTRTLMVPVGEPGPGKRGSGSGEWRVSLGGSSVCSWEMEGAPPALGKWRASLGGSSVCSWEVEGAPPALGEWRASLGGSSACSWWCPCCCCLDPKLWEAHGWGPAFDIEDHAHGSKHGPADESIPRKRKRKSPTTPKGRVHKERRACHCGTCPIWAASRNTPTYRSLAVSKCDWGVPLQAGGRKHATTAGGIRHANTAGGIVHHFKHEVCYCQQEAQGAPLQQEA